MNNRYVVLELVDPSDKRLKDTKKKKTRVVKKNLQPSWNEELVWEEVHHDLSDAFLKVHSSYTRRDYYIIYSIHLVYCPSTIQACGIFSFT